MDGKHKRNLIIACGLTLILLFVLLRNRMSSAMQSTDPMTNYGPDAAQTTPPQTYDPTEFSPARFGSGDVTQNYPGGNFFVGGTEIKSPSYMTLNVPVGRNETFPPSSTSITIGGTDFGKPGGNSSGCGGCKGDCKPSCECGGPQATLVTTIGGFINKNIPLLSANADNIASAIDNGAGRTTLPVETVPSFAY